MFDIGAMRLKGGEMMNSLGSPYRSAFNKVGSPEESTEVALNVVSNNATAPTTPASSCASTPAVSPQDNARSLSLESINHVIPFPFLSSVDSPQACRLADAYSKEIHPEEHYFLTELEEEWTETKPFKNCHILINAHMTLITLAQIRLLILAGATVEATASSELVTHKDTLDALQSAKVTFHLNGNIPEDRRQDYYDIVYDCGAGMLNVVTPKKGMVELTHTNPSLYSAAPFPVITVDNSQTKHLETGFGTGDSLVRLLQKLSDISMMTALQSFVAKDGSDLFESIEKRDAFINMLTLVDMKKWVNDKYMVFGYGKVGKGIVNALKHAGVPEKNIYIVEIMPQAYQKLKAEGFTNAILYSQYTKSRILSLLKDKEDGTPGIQFVITATGVANTISNLFELDDFVDVPFLINMGTPDEFGGKFPEDRILNKKKPANFMLARPTEVRFLDPIFWIWAYGGVELLSLTNTTGLHNISPETDEKILGKWFSKYPDVWSSSSVPQQQINAIRRAVKHHRPESPSGLTRMKFFELLAKFGAIQEKDAASLITQHPCGTPMGSLF